MFGTVSLSRVILITSLRAVEQISEAESGTFGQLTFSTFFCMLGDLQLKHNVCPIWVFNVVKTGKLAVHNKSSDNITHDSGIIKIKCWDFKLFKCFWSPIEELPLHAMQRMDLRILESGPLIHTFSLKNNFLLWTQQVDYEFYSGVEFVIVD